jgi:protein-disulfide isomerase
VKTQSARLAPPIDPERDHISGPFGAPIQLVEFGDYECPYCRKAHDAIRETQQKFGDDFCYVFRHLPNPKLHPHAEMAAEAAEAAAAQGKFWEMHDALFEHQSALDEADLLRYARTLALDTQRMARELKAQTFAKRVRDDFRSGVRSGANRTPTFFINEERYDGSWEDVDAFTRVLRDAVTQVSQHA